MSKRDNKSVHSRKVCTRRSIGCAIDHGGGMVCKSVQQKVVVLSLGRFDYNLSPVISISHPHSYCEIDSSLLYGIATSMPRFWGCRPTMQGRVALHAQNINIFLTNLSSMNIIFLMQFLKNTSRLVSSLPCLWWCFSLPPGVCIPHSLPCLP